MSWAGASRLVVVGSETGGRAADRSTSAPTAPWRPRSEGIERGGVGRGLRGPRPGRCWRLGQRQRLLAAAGLELEEGRSEGRQPGLPGLTGGHPDGRRVVARRGPGGGQSGRRGAAPSARSGRAQVLRRLSTAPNGDWRLPAARHSGGMRGWWREIAGLVLPVDCAGCGRPRTELCERCRGLLGGACPRGGCVRHRSRPVCRRCTRRRRTRTRCGPCSSRTRSGARSAWPGRWAAALAARRAGRGAGGSRGRVLLVPVPSARRAVAAARA